MNYTTGKKIHIYERDNSPAKHCVSGEYKEIDPNKINFNDWKEKSLDLDPDVDFTYWVFDIKISDNLKKEFKKENKKFRQERYIITNRRIVHVFNNDPYYHASGFHKKPENVVEMLKGLFMPDTITYSTDKGPSSYGLKNEKNKIKSFLNIQDNEYLRIQTSYLNESVSLIEDLDYILTNNLEIVNHNVILEESYLAPLQDKYLLIEKLLYTYCPDNVALGNSVRDYDGVCSLSLDEEQISVLTRLKDKTDILMEEIGCDYIIEGNDITLTLK